MALFIVDFCDQSTGGGGGSGSNVTSFTFDPVTDIANISTDLPASFNATIQGVKVDQTYFVSDAYGNNATAQPGSMNYKYKTYDAALTAAGADSLIYVMPGAYTSSSTFTVSGSRKVYFMPGAIIDYLAVVAFNVDPGALLDIRGYGNFQMGGLLYNPSNPNSSAIPRVYIECSQISSGTGVVQIGENTSMEIHIKVDQIREMHFNGTGWSKFHLEVDEWSGGGNGVMFLQSVFDFNGADKLLAEGPRTFAIKGRTRPRCFFKRSGAISATFGLTLLTGGLTTDTIGQVHMDCDTMDSFFIDVGTGITRWWGDTIHRRSGLAGNEIPWLYCAQVIADDRNAPYFEHVQGDWVSGAYNGSDLGVDPSIGLNNEIATVRCLGTFVFNGRYQNSGENVGLGAWPIFQFSNQNTNAGNTRMIFNCEMKNKEGAVTAVLQHVDGGVPGHTVEYIFKNTTVDCDKANDVFTSNVAGIPLYVHHSLTMRENFNPNFTDALSFSNIKVDRQIRVTVPEYPL